MSSKKINVIETLNYNVENHIKLKVKIIKSPLKSFLKNKHIMLKYKISVKSHLNL